ncbi:unnamed protein product [Lactuca saligna]|uniref:Uncharacterized protein n=1 Tax=Lactuca saligna TaxID=75948 RepID=A0AA35YN40_LACSI|nr:unnamed protein product [Lactuca saligna]
MLHANLCGKEESRSGPELVEEEEDRQVYVTYESLLLSLLKTHSNWPWLVELQHSEALSTHFYHEFYLNSCPLHKLVKFSSRNIAEYWKKVPEIYVQTLLLES